MSNTFVEHVFSLTENVGSNEKKLFTNVNDAVGITHYNTIGRYVHVTFR